MPSPRLKKALGQHHLRHGGLLSPLLEFLRPTGARVVEIGPGGGVLTGRLLDAGARRVWALELDLGWALALRRRERREGLQLLATDALAFPWERLPAPTLVTGNLPYNVATPLVTRVVTLHRQVPRAAFLVQREVAERLTASPGRRAYGSLSVMAAAWSRPRILGRVAPGAFRPPPKVESAFVGFELGPPPLPDEAMGSFEALVRLGFAHKRKTLRNSLAASWGRELAERALAAAGLDHLVRAEQLGLAEWLGLYAASEWHRKTATGA